MAPDAGLEIDDSRWPLVVVSWLGTTVTASEIDRFLQKGDEHLARREPYVALHDGVRATGIDAAQRKRLAAHVDANRAALAKYCVAAAIVASSPIVRGIVTAVNWMSPPPMSQRVFGTRANAESWLRELLRARGVSLP